MKFLTFVDVHEDKKSLNALLKIAKKPDIDFVVCAGDFTNFGKGVRYFFRIFNKLDKNIYVIPGNHEEQEGLIDNVIGEYSNCINFHEKFFEIGDYVFLGYGGGGFAQEDMNFRKVSRNWYGKFNGKKIILVTHMPPFNTKLDKLEKGHVGSHDYRKFIERIKPKIAISGHLHETAGETDSIGTTKLAQPGWEGMIIELK
jgi:uncharacterized protein